MNRKIMLRTAAAFVIAAALLATGCADTLQKLPGHLSDDAGAAPSGTTGTDASGEPTRIAVTTTTDTTASSTTATTATVATTETSTTATTATTAATTQKAPVSLNGQDVVDYAKQFLGTPYVFAGNDLRNGVDCSGFTQLVYAHFGISIPRTASAQHKKGIIVSYDELLPGDLCTTVYEIESKYTGHAAIYVGDGIVINALPEKGVVYTPLENLYGEYVFHRIFNNTYGR